MQPWPARLVRSVSLDLGQQLHAKPLGFRGVSGGVAQIPLTVSDGIAAGVHRDLVPLAVLSNVP
jgi:hypothetical protein